MACLGLNFAGYNTAHQQECPTLTISEKTDVTNLYTARTGLYSTQSQLYALGFGHIVYHIPRNTVQASDARVAKTVLFLLDVQDGCKQHLVSTSPRRWPVEQVWILVRPPDEARTHAYPNLWVDGVKCTWREVRCSSRPSPYVDHSTHVKYYTVLKCPLFE